MCILELNVIAFLSEEPDHATLIRRHSEDLRKSQFIPLVRYALTFTYYFLHVCLSFHSKYINFQKV